MGIVLTKQEIKRLCGRFCYENGEAYYLEHKVSLTGEDPDTALYEADVQGNELYTVKIDLAAAGDVAAECTCPSYTSFKDYCKHIAAVLLHIHDLQHGIEPPARLVPAEAVQEEPGLTSQVLDLFIDKRGSAASSRILAETRELLGVEFLCRLVPSGQQRHTFGLELRIGSVKKYAVTHIRAFLDGFERGEVCMISKHAAYDPRKQCFPREHEAVLRQLVHIYANERIYRDGSLTLSGYLSSGSAERRLLIPPYAWEQMFPLLQKTGSVRFEQDGRVHGELQVTDEQLPLSFVLDEAEEEAWYQLDITGLEQLIVMETYGLVVSQGRLHRVDPVQGRRLAELKQLLEVSKGKVAIRSEQVEAYIERVIPKLTKLGNVRISEAVSDRLLRLPLRAKLYLDRVRDRLLAGVEFQYGDILINPLEPAEASRGESRILLREGERERRILELMEQGSFVKTESGYVLNDEDAEYDFLRHIVPELEKMTELYATSAVKARLFTGHAPPSVRVEVDERTDWLEFRFELKGIPESDIREVIISLKQKRKFHRLRSGALLPLDSEAFQEMVRLLNETGLGGAAWSSQSLRLPVARGMHLLDTHGPEQAIQLGASARQLLEHMRHPERMEAEIPPSLEGVLREYQKYGYRWLRTMANYRFGGILADDMGLGKTIQSIAFLVSVLPEIREQGLPAIVVSPASLVYNWQHELKRFAPELRVRIADGTLDERKAALKDVTETDVLLTSYPVIRRDIVQYLKHSYHTLILDEAQAVKNHATQTAQAVKQLRARNRFALTGTPIENSLEELWSIYDIVFPGLLPGKRAFRELTREAVSRRIRPFLLRRLKSDVLQELPDKIETLQASELLPDQKKLYAALLAELQQEALKHLRAKDLQRSRIKILAGITRLRQICCHPSLFVEGYTGSSAKFEQLLELIQESRSTGKRMLIFSQFTEMLGIIRRELGIVGLPFFYLDGQTPPSDRVGLCHRFNEGERDVFLISLKAGGTGLNLTGADTVILYDLWWNPAVEQQAADRAHRMGQRKVVQVIRLVAEGTVEEKMYELQQRKRSLIDEVIRPGQESLSALSEQEIRELLML